MHIPQTKKIDLKNSSGYITFVTNFDKEIHKLNISDISEKSPMFDFVLKNDPDGNFKELSSGICIKLLEKNIDLKYIESETTGYIRKTEDNNCPNKTGFLSSNYLNFIYYYNPKEKYEYKTLSFELLRFAKKSFSEFSMYNRELFYKFTNVFNKYVIRILNNINEQYVICCVPSHEASETNSNTMSYVIDEVKHRYTYDYFIDGRDVLRRKYTITKSSSGEEKRTVERQLESIEVNNVKLIKDRIVLLIDDFYTTGSTMGACRKLLLDNGAKEVITFAFAKTRDLGWY